jgi:hypothetical protein
MQRPPPPTRETPAIYRIRVQGCVAARWSDWFGGLTLTEAREAAGPPVTTLTGLVPDQAALRGMVNKLWDLNLIVLAVERLPAKKEPNNEEQRT